MESHEKVKKELLCLLLSLLLLSAKWLLYHGAPQVDCWLSVELNMTPFGGHWESIQWYDFCECIVGRNPPHRRGDGLPPWTPLLVPGPK